MGASDVMPVREVGVLIARTSDPFSDLPCKTVGKKSEQREENNED